MLLPQAVYWLKCIICQKETKEKTQCPAVSKRHDLGAGYLPIERFLTWKKYCKRLAQQGVAKETQEIHSTPRKEKLMEAVRGLTDHAKGREVLLAFVEDIGPLISDAFC